MSDHEQTERNIARLERELYGYSPSNLESPPEPMTAEQAQARIDAAARKVPKEEIVRVSRPTRKVEWLDDGAPLLPLNSLSATASAYYVPSTNFTQVMRPAYEQAAKESLVELPPGVSIE